MLVAIVAIIIALMFIRKTFRKDSNCKNDGDIVHNGSFSNCPICSKPLLPHQNVRSKVFNVDKNKTDHLCYIYGCSNCFPECSSGANRLCPVCHKSLSKDDYLIARIFTKTKNGKPHVIINGCNGCK